AEPDSTFGAEPDSTFGAEPDSTFGEEPDPRLAAGRTNATRVPSAVGTTFCSGCGVVHTALAALPSIGTRHRSPSFGISRAAPSRDRQGSRQPRPPPSRMGRDIS